MLLCLSGCFGENYNVGHPTTKIETSSAKYDLKPYKIEWMTKDDSTSLNEEIENIVNSSDKIVASSGEKLNISFTDSIDKSGTYTDVEMEVSATKNGDEQLLYQYTISSTTLDEEHHFEAPVDSGEYVLEVTFTSNGDYAKYIGKLQVK